MEVEATAKAIEKVAEMRARPALQQLTPKAD
jgi:hypothetical protein